MSYLFDGLWAIDPTNPANVAADSVLTIFNTSDSLHAPIELTDADGLPISNPVQTNDKGFVGAFRAEFKRVGWISGELRGYISSFDGMIEDFDQAASAAGQAALDADASRVAAEKAAQLVQAPSDSVVASLVFEEGSETREALVAGFARKSETVFNVRDYGALGDGTNDDTAAIQLAIDAACAAGSGKVLVPPSTFNAPYRVGRLWIWADNITFKVDDGVPMMRKGGTWGLGNRDGRDMSKMPLKDLNDPYSGPSNITVTGGIWDGAPNDEPYVPEGFNCHMFNAGRNIFFYKMTIKDVVSNHALDMNGIDGLNIEHCKFLGFKDATVDQSRGYTEAIQLSTMNATPDSMGGFPLYSNGAPTRGVQIIGCEFGPSGTVGTQAWPTAFGNHSAINRSRDGLLTGAITARDNDFYGLTYVAITIYTWDNTTIDTNRFHACKAGIRANNFTQGRRWDPALKDYVTAPLREDTYDLKILKNTFTDSAEFDIQVLGTGVSSTDGSWGKIEKVTISENTRIRKLAGRSSQAFIRLLLCKTAIVSRNIGGHCSTGIAVQSCQDVTVTENEIVNTAGAGILVDATGGVTGGLFPAGDIEVQGNKTRDTGTHGISVVSNTGYSVISNVALNPGRLGVASGVMLSGSDAGLVSTNRVRATSLPFAVTGINATGSTNTNITLDNLIDGVTTRIANTGGAGTAYGNIQY